MSIRSFCLIFMGILAIGKLDASFREPWAGELLELNWLNQFSWQRFQSVDSDGKTIRYRSNDLFLNSSFVVALPDLTSFAADYSIEIGLMQASTRKQHGGIDHYSLTGSYHLLDDVQGDFLSLKVGLSYFRACGQSLYDISAFHHGREEGELFFSFGLDDTCRLSRWWVAGALGFADRGSPWSRLNIDYAYTLLEKHVFALKCSCLYGFGQGRLKVKQFKGYGSIAHRSVDLGLNYSLLLDHFGRVGLSYTYRLYAKNFPQRAQVIQVEWTYTFGLINQQAKTRNLLSQVPL